MRDGPMRAILSIQSEVAYGHVGNSAAVLPLQRLGFDVWPVNTVQLGHHPGYGRFRGYRVEPERLAVVLDAVLDQAPLEHCTGIIVGYLGDGEVADLVLRALDTVKARRGDVIFLLDPVIGDDGPGLFVRPKVPVAIANQLLPRASIITPNRFELAYFSGVEVGSIDEAQLAAKGLLECGPDLIVATGLPSPVGPDELAMLAMSSKERWLIRTPRLDRTFSGTGDAFSAIMLGHFLLASDLKTAFERAASVIFSVVETTQNRGEEELSLIAAQELLTAPIIRFSATPL